MIDGKQLKNSSIRETKLSIQADFSVNSNKITDLANPTNDDDAATKRYVDAVSQGLLIKDACRAATNSVSDLSGFIYSNITDKWTNVTSPAFDSISLNDQDRVLIKDASDARGNGIWYYNDPTNEFLRTADADNAGAPLLSELRGGCFTFITTGTNNADTGWVISSPNGEITLGTDSIVWSQFSGAGSITAGAGLSKVGSTLSVNVDSVGIEIFADTLRLKAGGITGDKFNATTAGEGLSLNGISNAYDVNVDDSTIEIDTDTLQVKEDGITLTEIQETIFGNGLTVGATVAVNIGDGFQFTGTVLDLKPNANDAVAIDANGINASSIVEVYDNPLAGSGFGTPDVDFDTGITLPTTPAGNSMVIIYLNGLKEDVSYGDKTGTFWFEPSGGGAARAAADLIATDELHFNPNGAGFALEADDGIELIYSKLQ